MTSKVTKHAEWHRFLLYMEQEVKPRCSPQRQTLAGGPFEWLQSLSGTTFGNRVGPLIVRFFLDKDMQPRENTDHDFIFKGRKVELKTGTEHATPGLFLFEQIRPQHDWDVVLCLGICVESLVFYVLTRSFVEESIQAWKNTGRAVIFPQHGGARRRSRAGAQPDTFWMWTSPEWEDYLKKYRARFDPSGWDGPLLKDALVR